MKSTKKKLLSFLTAASVAATMFTGMISAMAAPDYGSEWGGRNSESNLTGSGTTNTTTTTTTTTAIDANSSTVSASTGTFSDVPTTHWAYKAVERCAATQWFDGYPDGTFRPDGKISRAEALKVFVTFMGLPLSTVTSSSYYDVSATAWYAPYIETGKDLFPTRTALDGQSKFQPDMPVTREDTIYALVKALRYDGRTVNADLSVLNMFSDQNSITTSVKPYVAVAVANGLASGYDDGTIGAQDPLTRAEFATLLYRGTYIAPDDSSDLPKVTSSITIEPSVYKEIVVGESFEITATINYTDGTSEDYTNKLNPYTDSIEGVVTINKNKVTGVGTGTVLINYNAEDDAASSQTLVVEVKPDPNAATPEPTAEPTPEPTPEPVIPETAGIVKANVDKEEAAAPVVTRYTVLVMDVSGSMYGTKLDAAKDAAKSFCSTVLGAGANDNIAIVQFESSGSYTRVICDFTNDLSKLNSAINGMSAGGTTDIYDGIKLGEGLLDGITESNVTAKSLVVMTDGYPCDGPTSTTGKYSASDDISYYAYANTIYNASQESINKGYDIYTIGFYTSPSEQNSFTATMLKDIQNKGFYLATDTSKLVDVFKNISGKLIVSGVTVELKDGDLIIDSCTTNKGACDFSFTVNPGTYTLEISAPGYTTYTKSVTVNSDETIDLGSIILPLE